MPEIYVHKLTVTDSDIDRVGHVNNRAYLKWMETAAVAHSSANTWPPERYDEIGFGWVAKSHFIEYHRPAFLDDEILVRTWVSGFKRVSSVRRYRIERPADNALLATAETNWAFVSLQTLLPARILPEVADCFTPVDPDAQQESQDR